MNRFIFIFGLIILVFLASLSLAGIPKMINYQGMLTGSDGKTPVTNGNYPILFSIYNTSSGGSSLWSHTYNVGVTNGLFNVILGDSGAPINLPFDTTYWLGIKVGADPQLSPRTRLTSVGYAYRAMVADSAVTSAKIAVPLSLSGSSSNPIISVANSSTGDGVYGGSSRGKGVDGYNDSTGNFGYLGSSKYGVYGGSSSGTGVNGYTPGFHFGVYGQSDGTNGTGVCGVANNGSAAAGVWGSSTSGYAGYFDGDVGVTGTLYKGGLAFKIDDPVDPGNRYLCHSGVESPDMMNIYNGIVTLDANGEAKVELPDYFEALNKDFRYQLTCIGDFAPVYIAERISNNQFKIAGGKSNLEVSWQVTGIRHDPFAQAHRIQVDVEKTGVERGKYLHPKEYGVSETLGINYEKTHETEAREQQQQLEQERMKAEYLKTQTELEKK